MRAASLAHAVNCPSGLQRWLNIGDRAFGYRQLSISGFRSTEFELSGPRSDALGAVAVTADDEEAITLNIFAAIVSLPCRSRKATQKACSYHGA